MAGAPLNIAVGDAPRELRAAVLAMARADKEVRRDVMDRMRGTMAPEWRANVVQRLTGWTMEAQMLTPGIRIAGGNPPQLVAAHSRRRVGNGLIPDRHFAGYEWGASRDDTSDVTRNGKTFQRHTKNHLPRRRANGRVLGPAVRAILPRIASFWAQSVIRAFMDAAEGRK